jgi:serine/threonine protein kinase
MSDDTSSPGNTRDQSTQSGDSGFASTVFTSVHALPDGTRLDDYQLVECIGEGGFGIVYLADDLTLQRRVAIKEYLPSSMASRSRTSVTVVVQSSRHSETFALGLKSFINEARLLAQFDHPSLVKVYRFWEGNGTAYMVMPYYEGPTLKHALAGLGRSATEAELQMWLTPLMDALSVMHAVNCFHRDIAPDNILLTSSGPLLLDFGAARRVIGDMTHALTVVLKPGYAPIEQYGESSTMTQGAWTDLYALASVMYAAITGQAPTPSVDRLMEDKLQPLNPQFAGRYSVAFLQAIDAALALRPKDRPQSIEAFQILLGWPTTPAAPTGPYNYQAKASAQPSSPRSEARKPFNSESETTVITPPTLGFERNAPDLTEATVANEATKIPTIKPSGLVASAASTTKPWINGWGITGLSLLGLISLSVAAYWSWLSASDTALPPNLSPTTSGSTAAASSASAPKTNAVVNDLPKAPETLTSTSAATPATVVSAPQISTENTATVNSSDGSLIITPGAAASGVEVIETTVNPVAAEPSAQSSSAAFDTTPQAFTNHPSRKPKSKSHPHESRPAEPLSTTPPSKRGKSLVSRCSDIVQKASLESLSDEEAAFLKKECQ